MIKIFLFNFIFLFGLTSCNENNNELQNIDLKEYLPNHNEGTIYKFGLKNNNDFDNVLNLDEAEIIYETEIEKTISEKTGNCVFFEQVVYENGNMVNKNILYNICAQKRKLYTTFLSKNYDILNLNKESWEYYNDKMHDTIDKKTCYFEGVTLINVLEKNYSSLVVKCKSKDNSSIWKEYYIEKLGLVQLETYDSNGNQLEIKKLIKIKNDL